MLKILADDDNRFLIIVAEGTITEDDIDGCADTMEDSYPEFGVRIRSGAHDGVGVLIDWEKLDGWAMGAKTLGTLMTRTMRDVIRRVAIVADDKWRDEEERIGDIASEATVRFFNPRDRQAAIDWLKEG